MTPSLQASGWEQLYCLLQSVWGSLAYKASRRPLLLQCSCCRDILRGYVSTSVVSPLGNGFPGHMMTVITFGTFDVFHVGHLRILQRAASLGDRLIVGVSSDELNVSKKGRTPVFPQDERMQILRALKYVDEVFLEESLELKRAYVTRYRADILAMGCDWRGKFDELSDICQVVYFDRTPAVSTTAVIEKIRV